MAGKTGYTAISNGSAFGFDQINGGFAHFDALIGETVATATSLPASGNWTGRTVFVQDVAGLSVWDGTKWVATRSDTGRVNVTSFGNGFTAYSGSGWSGVKYRILNGVVYLNGAATNTAAWTAGTAICNLPIAARPTVQIQGANCTVEVGGNVVTIADGGPGGISFSAVYPLG